jgi:hypothetical protein
MGEHDHGDDRADADRPRQLGHRESPRHRRSGEVPVPRRVGTRHQERDTVTVMCRNITTLRGLEPHATDEEIEAAARQYVRKVSGVQATSAASEAAFERAVALVTEATTELLDALPPRRQPPKTVPPLRRQRAAG